MDNEELINDMIEVDSDDYLGFANTPLKDSDGFTLGKLVRIEKKQIINKKNRTSKELADDITQKCYNFIFCVEGVNEPIYIRKLTGTNIRPEKIHIKAKGRGKKQEKPEYNALTEMCLRLKIFSIEELEQRNNTLLTKTRDAIKNISEENPIYIKTKLHLTDDNDAQFETINVKTIEVIPQFKMKSIEK